MAKEEFVRTKSHANVGTTGHVDHPSQSDDSGILKPGASDFQLSQRRLLLGGLGFIILAVVIAGGIFVLADQDQLPPNVEPPVEDLGAALPPPQADITLERGYTSKDDLWTWAAQDCVPDYAPLAHTACLETDDTFLFVFGRAHNGEMRLPNCQTPLYAFRQDGDLVQAPPGAQAEEQFFTIELIQANIASNVPQADNNSKGGLVVQTEMLQLDLRGNYAPESNQVPLILVLYDTALPGSTQSGAVVAANFNYKVHVDSVPSNILTIEPQVDPDTDDVIGPSLALFGNPDDPDMPYELVDLSAVDPDTDGTLLALMRMVPSTQLFPPVIPPLCDPETAPPVVETQEPVNVSPPGVCGDLVCDTSTENSDLCPGDCPCVDDGVCAPGEGESCRDCGSSAGGCSAACSDSSQCAEGLSCAGSICWDAQICGGSTGGGSGGDNGGGDDSCPCQVVCLERDREGNCIRRATQDCNGNVCTP